MRRTHSWGLFKYFIYILYTYICLHTHECIHTYIHTYVYTYTIHTYVLEHKVHALHIYTYIRICIACTAWVAYLLVHKHLHHILCLHWMQRMWCRQCIYCVRKYVHTYIQFCGVKCPLKNPFSFCDRHPVVSISRYRLVYDQIEHITFNTIHVLNAICFGWNKQPNHVLLDECTVFELLCLLWL